MQVVSYDLVEPEQNIFARREEARVCRVLLSYSCSGDFAALPAVGHLSVCLLHVRARVPGAELDLSPALVAGGQSQRLTVVLWYTRRPQSNNMVTPNLLPMYCIHYADA